MKLIFCEECFELIDKKTAFRIDSCLCDHLFCEECFTLLNAKYCFLCELDERYI